MAINSPIDGVVDVEMWPPRPPGGGTEFPRSRFIFVLYRPNLFSTRRACTIINTLASFFRDSRKRCDGAFSFSLDQVFLCFFFVRDFGIHGRDSFAKFRFFFFQRSIKILLFWRFSRLISWFRLKLLSSCCTNYTLKRWDFSQVCHGEMAIALYNQVEWILDVERGFFAVEDFMISIWIVEDSQQHVDSQKQQFLY